MFAYISTRMPKQKDGYSTICKRCLHAKEACDKCGHPHQASERSSHKKVCKVYELANLIGVSPREICDYFLTACSINKIEYVRDIVDILNGKNKSTSTYSKNIYRAQEDRKRDPYNVNRQKIFEYDAWGMLNGVEPDDE